jgi:DNA-directed RNA polymerase subunit RPC12/RpoP
MNFVEFVKKFPTEASCIRYFKQVKESKGIVCKKCGNTHQYWNKTHKSHDCSECGYRTTLKSGTVMESSNLPYIYWLYAIFLMTMTKKGISAAEMQRQLDHKRYEPIWLMMHKLRLVMGMRDDKYDLQGVVELDDAFFKSYSETKTNETTKRGRGSQKQSKVLVMAKVDPKQGRPKKHKKPSAFRYVKMVVIPDSSSQTMNEVVQGNISTTAIVKSDGWQGFSRIKEITAKHIVKIVSPQEASKALPWVHTMISNAKRNFLGINHKIKEEYLQNYLDEFCYKTNRRYFGFDLFERLMDASVEDTWYGKFRYHNG